jgi:hypothetical protein
MITRIDPVSSTFPDLTGNSSIVKIATDIYVVSNIRVDGNAVIYKSSDQGQTFSIIHTITLPAGTKKFDPVLITDGTDLHFLGSTAYFDFLRYDVHKYKYVVATDTLTQTTLMTGSKSHGGYDLIRTTDGNFQAAISVLESVTPAVPAGILCYTLDNTDTAINYSAILNSKLGTGTLWSAGVTTYKTLLPHTYVVGDKVVVESATPTTYNGIHTITSTTLDTFSVSSVTDPGTWVSGGQVIKDDTTIGGLSMVITPGDTTSVDIFYTEHPRVLLFKDKNILVNRIKTTPGAGTFVTGSIQTIQSTSARYTDDKLTVLKTATDDLVITQSYSIQTKEGTLTSSSLVGYLSVAPLSTWNYKTFNGTNTVSWAEPTPSINAVSEIFISVLEFPITNKVVAESGFLQTYLLDPLTMGITPIVTNVSQSSYTGLRGSKDYSDNLSDWYILGYKYNRTTKAGDVYYISHLNLPPVVSISPTSVNLVRGIEHIVDASTTYDPDLDPMDFVWTSDDITGKFHVIGSGPTISVIAEKAIGPAARTITLTLTVTDTVPAGVPANTPQVATVPLYLTLNHAPVITMPTLGTHNAARNDIYTIVPTVTDVDGDVLSYSWLQTAGTVVQTSSKTLKDLEVKLYRTNPVGEILTFQLTVTDEINTAVIAEMDIVVPAIGGWLLDSSTLTKTRPNPNRIALRNTSSSWTEPAAITPTSLSDAFLFKSGTNTNGLIRKLFISSKSVLVMDDYGVGAPTFYRRRISYRGNILDAVHTEDDVTYLLISDVDGLSIFKYSSPGFNNISDYPDQELLLTTLVSGTFNRISATFPFQGARVFALSGEFGIFLFQVSTTNLEDVRQNMFISTETETLVGANNIQFIRFADMENLNSGRILIGSLDTNGNSYETLLELSNKRVIGAWDKGNTINQNIFTGELLFKTNNTYLGTPQAPVLNSPLSSGSIIVLSWSQVRSDLVDYYDIEMATDSGTFLFLKRVNSGIILTTATDGFDIINHQYKFRMISGNKDGISPYSNIVQIGILPSIPPQMILIQSPGNIL